MPDDTSEESTVHSGLVKWFDSTKGYGFVVCEGVARDILLHANVLRNFGQNSVADGAKVRLRVVETDRGIQAQEVLEIEAPEFEGADDGMSRSLPFDETLVGGDLEPARVKWFDRAKGFGFANVFGLGEDVFIHVEVLRRSSLADLQPGEAIAIRVAEGARGRLATQVNAWEHAVGNTGLAELSAETDSVVEFQGREAAE
ncbi:Cold shock protein CspA [Rhodobacteraceae bacterium THAF1]|uniref:cold-shock protein n=1 Tax=Palleronia sp. THAF1 TaxID=2587842 RepID=UPI000F3D1E11|nr:cold shock domain-containing protein [Palleronia sp. THAF1]QFU08410.1 Cold shock protein CspA [Palleronia sp. THAF1]VDC29206.1 Cold shock protein CspA [Rhodobacteraceae bacterium THAF1]